MYFEGYRNDTTFIASFFTVGHKSDHLIDRCKGNCGLFCNDILDSI